MQTRRKGKEAAASASTQAISEAQLMPPPPPRVPQAADTLDTPKQQQASQAFDIQATTKLSQEQIDIAKREGLTFDQAESLDEIMQQGDDLLLADPADAPADLADAQAPKSKSEHEDPANAGPQPDRAAIAAQAAATAQQLVASPQLSQKLALDADYLKANPMSQLTNAELSKMPVAKMADKFIEAIPGAPTPAQALKSGNDALMQETLDLQKIMVDKLATLIDTVNELKTSHNGLYRQHNALYADVIDVKKAQKRKAEEMATASPAGKVACIADTTSESTELVIKPSVNALEITAAHLFAKELSSKAQIELSALHVIRQLGSYATDTKQFPNWVLSRKPIHVDWGVADPSQKDDARLKACPTFAAWKQGSKIIATVHILLEPGQDGCDAKRRVREAHERYMNGMANVMLNRYQIENRESWMNFLRVDEQLRIAAAGRDHALDAFNMLPWLGIEGSIPDKMLLESALGLEAARKRDSDPSVQAARQKALRDEMHKAGFYPNANLQRANAGANVEQQPPIPASTPPPGQPRRGSIGSSDGSSGIVRNVRTAYVERYKGQIPPTPNVTCKSFYFSQHGRCNWQDCRWKASHYCLHCSSKNHGTNCCAYGIKNLPVPEGGPDGYLDAGVICSNEEYTRLCEQQGVC